MKKRLILSITSVRINAGFALWAVSLVLAIQSAQARTLGDRYREKEQLKAEALAEEAKVQKLQNSISSLKSQYGKKSDDKKNLVTNYRNHLENQGNEVVKNLNKTVEDLLFLKTQLSSANANYEHYLQKNVESYKELSTKFQKYHQTETERREGFKKNLVEAQQAQSVAMIVQPRHEIFELYQDEIETQSKLAFDIDRIRKSIRQVYRDYEARVEPLKAEMERFGLQRLPPPDEILSRLDQIEQYGTVRREYFSRIFRQKFPAIEQRIRQIVDKSVQVELTEIEKSAINERLTAAWINTVKQLQQKRVDATRNRSNRIPTGCGTRVRPFYDVFIEVLPHKERCRNLEELMAKKSPYEYGCTLLRTLLKEAENFFVAEAWNDMSLSLFLAKTGAPKHLAPLIEKLAALQKHEREGLEKPDLLLKAIKYHDQLLEEWQAWNEANGNQQGSEN